jgi:hypothetical protein
MGIHAEGIPQFSLEVDTPLAKRSARYRSGQERHQRPKGFAYDEAIADENFCEAHGIARFHTASEPPFGDIEKLLAMNEGREIHPSRLQMLVNPPNLSLLVHSALLGSDMQAFPLISSLPNRLKQYP